MCLLSSKLVWVVAHSLRLCFPNVNMHNITWRSYSNIDWDPGVCLAPPYLLDSLLDFILFSLFIFEDVRSLLIDSLTAATFGFKISQQLFFFFNFYFSYRINNIYLNTVTFTQIIISWILRNRLSDSLWRSGIENMLRQIGNLYFIPFCMAFIFTTQYYLLCFNFSLKIRMILKLCILCN